MINIQDYISNSNLFKKFEVDNLLFIEIICPVGEDAPSGMWWDNNFFSYAIAGEMALRTMEREYILKAGDCIFAKKGSIISAHHLIQEAFCELRVFVPDHFIKSVFQKHRIPSITESDIKTDTLIPLQKDELLDVYFHSLLTYFRQGMPPSELLLKLKFEELVVTILSNNIHRPLKCFFSDLCRSEKPSVKAIMEANFFCNLSLEEFARLCTRSLSVFKEEFRDIFQTSPGKWLLEKRLKYSRYLLETTGLSIDEVCAICGFENRSHFNRVFKKRYGWSPGRYTKQK